MSKIQPKQKAIEKLLEFSKSKGYVSFNDILDAIDFFNLNINEVDSVSDQLLVLGCTIRECEMSTNQAQLDIHQNGLNGESKLQNYNKVINEKDNLDEIDVGSIRVNKVECFEGIFKEIPSKIYDNQDIKKMIQYLNNSIKGLDIVILERKKERNAYFVVPKKIYEENLIREKNGEKTIGNRNVLTCWQFKSKIILSIRPIFNPSKYMKRCTFLNVSDFEEENINTVIKNKYEELLKNT